jgi:Domain of unknown function (DUF6457)
VSDGDRPGGGATASSDVDPAAVAWIGRFAAELGLPPPSPEEIGELLSLASTAAHASHRQAAPVACWLAARAGLSPAEALGRATDLPV